MEQGTQAEAEPHFWMTWMIRREVGEEVGQHDSLFYILNKYFCFLQARSLNSSSKKVWFPGVKTNKKTHLNGCISQDFFDCRGHKPISNQPQSKGEFVGLSNSSPWSGTCVGGRGGGWELRLTALSLCSLCLLFSVPWLPPQGQNQLTATLLLVLASYTCPF